ncbi:MAG: hypothetical protein ABFR82_08160 [Nitrospirota bacterium]
MSFWDQIQKDIGDNLKEGLSIVKEGSEAITHKLEKLTDEGKKKYKVFNLNMKVQDEFARLGGQIYDLIVKKSKNPLSNKSVTSIISKINKLETQISKYEDREIKAKVKTTAKKTRKKSTAKKTTTKKAAAKKTATKKTSTKKATVKKTPAKAKSSAAEKAKE